jgi:hypothetical protein
MCWVCIVDCLGSCCCCCCCRDTCVKEEPGEYVLCMYR